MDNVYNASKLSPFRNKEEPVRGFEPQNTFSKKVPTRFMALNINPPSRDKLHVLTTQILSIRCI